MSDRIAFVLLTQRARRASKRVLLGSFAIELIRFDHGLPVYALDRVRITLPHGDFTHVTGKVTFGGQAYVCYEGMSACTQVLIGLVDGLDPIRGAIRVVASNIAWQYESDDSIALRDPCEVDPHQVLVAVCVDGDELERLKYWCDPANYGSRLTPELEARVRRRNGWVYLRPDGTEPTASHADGSN